MKFDQLLSVCYKEYYCCCLYAVLGPAQHFCTLTTLYSDTLLPVYVDKANINHFDVILLQDGLQDVGKLMKNVCVNVSFHLLCFSRENAFRSHTYCGTVTENSQWEGTFLKIGLLKAFLIRFIS